MADRFETHARNLTGPADHGFSITPSDSADLTEVTRALYVGTGGDIVATLSSGVDVTFKNVPTGSVLPIRCQRIKATNTNATNLVGLV